MASYTWNHGRISRQAAEELLLRKAIDGAFLVRKSESVDDAYVLSLWFGDMVHHFRFLNKENKLAFEVSNGNTSAKFSTLAEVIEVFKQPGQGLPCALKEPIVKEVVNDLYHDSDEDEQEIGVANDDVTLTDENLDQSDDTAVSSALIAKISEMDTSEVGEEFCDSLRSYLHSGFALDGTRMNTSTPAADLQQLIVNSAGGVSRELKEFLKKIMFLQELFSPGKDADKLTCFTSISSSTSARVQARTNDIGAYDNLVTNLAKCVAGIKSLQMLAQKSYQEHANFMSNQLSQTRTFEVNTCGNFKTRAFLKIDITKGKLWFMKNENDSSEDCSVVDHDKILQLVKDPDIPKLTLKIDNKSNREYMFKDVQARENLCQLAQHMINIHAPCRKEPKQISVFAGTWNMGSETPPGIDTWLRCHGLGETIKDEGLVEVVGHDIYAFGTQESSIGENTWTSRLIATLRKLFRIEYYPVAVCSLWGIRLVVLAKREHRNRISRIEKSSVKTGIANKLGNKGGVGISFDFLSTSLCFINSHLASGNEDERKKRRQQNYRDILKGLNLGHKSAYDLTNQFHHVFWLGDLNYRIDMTYEEILTSIKELNYKNLISEDQLRKEQSNENVFFGFSESDPHFPPTYRYKRGSRDSYDHIKVKRSGTRINVPSWCDRVLWKSFPELSTKQISYGCTEDIATSDHSPVFSSFEVPITSQFVASKDQAAFKSQANKPSRKIIIQSIKVKVKTRSKTNFYVEFHSFCLAESQKSSVGKTSPPWEPPRAVESVPTVNRFYEWNTSMLPELNPILDDLEYLREQHLLIAVKSEGGDESYGECVVSLKAHLFDSPQHFLTSLTHGGIKTGEMEGEMNVQHGKQPAVRRPVIQVKPDSVSRKQTSATPHYRPQSCVAPSTVESIPNSKKSASLGRQSQAPFLHKGRTLREKSNDGPNLSSPGLSRREKGFANPGYSHGTSMDETSYNPPPLPVKACKMITFPSSVNELLSKLGLESYLSNLEDNGFDDISFLEDISNEDLADSGITDGEHIRKILNEVQFLKKSGMFKS